MQEMRDMSHELFERGRGNVCSVEFNCLYRWHATTSAEDEEWIGMSLHDSISIIIAVADVDAQVK